MKKILMKTIILIIGSGPVTLEGYAAAIGADPQAIAAEIDRLQPRPEITAAQVAEIAATIYQPAEVLNTSGPRPGKYSGKKLKKYPAKIGRLKVDFNRERKVKRYNRHARQNSKRF